MTITETADTIEKIINEAVDELNTVNGNVAIATLLYRKRTEDLIPAGDVPSWNANVRVEDAVKEAVVTADDIAVALRRCVQELRKSIKKEEEIRATANAHSLSDPVVRKQVFNLTGGKCAYCDTQLVESGGEHDQFCIEHVVPSSMGGPNHLVNYVPSCRSCNNSKGDRHVLYFIRNSFVLRDRKPAPVSPITPIAEAAE